MIALGTRLGAWASLALLCACATTSPIDQRSIAMSNDREAISATLSALNAACAARDLNAFMALFDDNDDILFVGSDKSEVFRGREATRGFMQVLYGLPFVFSFQLDNVVLHQSDDHAWVFVDGKMVRRGDRGDAVGKVGQSPYRFSIAMVRRGGAWRWQMFNGSVPRGE